MTEERPVEPQEPTAKAVETDVVKFGDIDAWQLFCKASSKKYRWVKTTKVLNTGGGCLVSVSTTIKDNVAEALAFVPDARIDRDADGQPYIHGVGVVQATKIQPGRADD